MSQILAQKNNDDMVEFWNGVGGRKWVSYQNRLDQSLLDYGRAAMLSAEIMSGHYVLDVGCGCGDTSLDIAGIVGQTGQVTGVDVSELILQQAKMRIKNASSPNVEFACRDAEYFNFEKQKYDVVYSRFGVMFFSDPTAAFTNLGNALKPGGRLAFICWQSVSANQWVSLPLEVASKYAPAPPPPGDEPGPFSFADKGRLTNIIECAGFCSVSIQEFTSNFILGETAEDAAKFVSTVGPASYLRDDPDIEEKMKGYFLNELSQTLRMYKTSEGIELAASTWLVSAIKI